MSRIRSIKPEFWASEQVLECSRNARLLFIGLWNFCDDAGRHPHSAKQCKAEVFPADDLTEQEITSMLLELSTNGLITTYLSAEKTYFYVTGWKHQRIDKPQSPKYPAPFQDHSKKAPGPIPPDTIGEDRKGEEKKKRSQGSRGSSLPDDWQPTAVDVAYGITHGFTEQQVAGAAEDMRLWAKANSNRGVGRKADWSATFKGWMRRTKGKSDGKAPTVVEAQRQHIANRIEFGPRPSLIPSAAGGGPVRLLPKGGRERPGDLHGGDHLDPGGVLRGGGAACDGPQDGDSPKNKLAPDDRGS